MTEEQRKRQRCAVAATYKRRIKDGVYAPLANDTGESMHLWASAMLGRIVSTLTTLGDYELNCLRDILEGKPPKVHARLREILTRTKHHPDAYVNHLMHHAPAYARYRIEDQTYTVETLPLVEAYRILVQEESRGDHSGTRKRDWKHPLKQPRGDASRVSTEQATLWGMQ